MIPKKRGLPGIGDITDKSPENFSGHLVAPDHEFGGIYARSMHLKFNTKRKKGARRQVQKKLEISPL